MTPLRLVARTVSSAALLLPLLAGADSTVATGTGRLSAAAHVAFKIVIPASLYLGVEPNAPAGDPQRRVSIASSGRAAMLGATLRPSNTILHSEIVSSSGRQAISRFSACTDRRPASTEPSGRLVCTASMP